jgi:hypothetical protein
MTFAVHTYWHNINLVPWLSFSDHSNGLCDVMFLSRSHEDLELCISKTSNSSLAYVFYVVAMTTTIGMLRCMMGYINT